jgi:hypothetical protein
MPIDMDMVIALAFSFLMTVVVVLTIGGIILLRPISKHLGQYLEAKANERKALEERQDFTERLLSTPRNHVP